MIYTLIPHMQHADVAEFILFEIQWLFPFQTEHLYKIYFLAYYEAYYKSASLTNYKMKVVKHFYLHLLVYLRFPHTLNSANFLN